MNAPYHHFTHPPQPRHPHGGGGADQHAFRMYYSHELQNLTFNSRPIITQLTMVAHENSFKMAPVVVQCIEEWLRNCPPFGKLPALYLIDSICKNIGTPYSNLFARQLAYNFLSIYRDVDDSVKIKMEELLGTWRTGGPGGRELFPLRVQNEIEDALFGKGGRGGGFSLNENRYLMSGARQEPGMATESERQEVLQEVRRALDFRLAKQAVAPLDTSNQSQIQVLHQIKAVAQDQQITSEQAHQIIEQLANMTQSDEPQKHSSLSNTIPSSSAQPSSSYSSSSQHRPSMNLQSLASVLDPETISRAAQGFPATPAGPSGAPSSSLSSQSVLPDTLKGIDTSFLNNIAGLGGGSRNTLIPVPSISEKQKDSAQEWFDQAILSAAIALDGPRIQERKPKLYKLLYHDLPNQCKQCGARYAESELGRSRMTFHLDRHFKYNKSTREATRAQGRAWFVDEEEWLQPPAISKGDVGKDAEDVNEAAKEKNSAASSVVVRPSDPSLVSKPCPICKEGFQSEFRESEEEWIWKDAVVVDGAYYHATCYSETMKSRLAAMKLKEEHSALNSREATPTAVATTEQTKDEVKEEVKDEAKEEMKDEAKEEIKEEDKEEIKEEDKEEIKEDVKEKIKEEDKEEIKEDFEGDVKEEIKEEAEEDVKEEMKSEVKEEKVVDYANVEDWDEPAAVDLAQEETDDLSRSYASVTSIGKRKTTDQDDEDEISDPDGLYTNSGDMKRAKTKDADG